MYKARKLLRDLNARIRFEPNILEYQILRLVIKKSLGEDISEDSKVFTKTLRSCSEKDRDCFLRILMALQTAKLSANFDEFISNVINNIQLNLKDDFHDYPCRFLSDKARLSRSERGTGLYLHQNVNDDLCVLIVHKSRAKRYLNLSELAKGDVGLLFLLLNIQPSSKEASTPIKLYKEVEVFITSCFERMRFYQVGYVMASLIYFQEKSAKSLELAQKYLGDAIRAYHDSKPNEYYKEAYMLRACLDVDVGHKFNARVDCSFLEKLTKGQHPTVFIVKGYKAVKNMDYKGALKEYKVAIKLSPNEALYRYYAGNAGMAFGKYEDALEEFAIAKKLDPNDRHYGSLYHYCSYLCDDSEKKESQLIDKAIELDPYFIEANFAKIEILRKKNMPSRAIRFCSKAIGPFAEGFSSTDIAGFYHLRSQCYKQTGRIRSAYFDLLKYMETSHDKPSLGHLIKNQSKLKAWKRMIDQAETSLSPKQNGFVRKISFLSNGSSIKESFRCLLRKAEAHFVLENHEKSAEYDEILLRDFSKELSKEDLFCVYHRIALTTFFQIENEQPVLCKDQLQKIMDLYSICKSYQTEVNSDVPWFVEETRARIRQCDSIYQLQEADQRERTDFFLENPECLADNRVTLRFENGTEFSAHKTFML